MTGPPRKRTRIDSRLETSAAANFSRFRDSVGVRFVLMNLPSSRHHRAARVPILVSRYSVAVVVSRRSSPEISDRIWRCWARNGNLSSLWSLFRDSIGLGPILAKNENLDTIKCNSRRSQEVDRTRRHSIRLCFHCAQQTHCAQLKCCSCDTMIIIFGPVAAYVWRVSRDGLELCHQSAAAEAEAESDSEASRVELS